MGALVQFQSLEDSWLTRRGLFEAILYHSVIRNSERERLPTLFPDVEREISQYLFSVDPARYPGNEGSIGLIQFDTYPEVEREEFLRAVRAGVEEIRTTPRDAEFLWNFDRKDTLVMLGEELIELMARSLEQSDPGGSKAAETGAEATSET